jgi:uncharacterized protein
MQSVAVAIICKTPIAGLCKTRLSPPLRHEECAAISACFIRDLSATIDALARADSDLRCYAVYTPTGSEARLRTLLPRGFRLLPQSNGDLGARLLSATVDLLDAGHDGAILVNSDSPTLPLSILRAAVRAVRQGDVVLSPALDGGYTLIGLTNPHARLFADIPWSTPQVYHLTLERAREINLPVVAAPQWYDIDDEYTLRLLQAELAGERLTFAAAGLSGADALATRRFLGMRSALARMRAAS